MKIHSKIYYGLDAIIEIALADKRLGILQKEIAEKCSISEKYLDQIIFALKTAGLITNPDNKKRGYVLAKNDTEITMYDIFNALSSNKELLQKKGKEKKCKKASELMVFGLNKVIVTYLSSYSLRKLKEEKQHLSEMENNIINYYI